MNIHVKEYKLQVGDKKYTFRLDMLAAIKIEEKYGDFAEIFNGLMAGEKFYSNAFKLLSCCCKEREWEYEELAQSLSIHFAELKKLDTIVQEMYTNFELFKEPEETEKNEMSSQSNMK